MYKTKTFFKHHNKLCETAYRYNIPNISRLIYNMNNVYNMY